MRRASNNNVSIKRLKKESDGVREERRSEELLRRSALVPPSAPLMDSIFGSISAGEKSSLRLFAIPTTFDVHTHYCAIRHITTPPLSQPCYRLHTIYCTFLLPILRCCAMILCFYLLRFWVLKKSNIRKKETVYILLATSSVNHSLVPRV